MNATVRLLLFKHYFMLAFLFEDPTMAKERKLLCFSSYVIPPTGIFSSTIELSMSFGEREEKRESARRGNDSSGVLCSLVLWGQKNTFNQCDVATVQKRREKSTSGVDRPETKNKGHFEFLDSHHN